MMPPQHSSARRYLALIVFIAGGFCSAACDNTSLSKSVDALKARAKQGDAIAQFNLGVAYHVDKGVPRDEEEALKWMQNAAAQGYAPAQSKLGLHYLGIAYNEGKTVPPDDGEGVKWMRQAAAQGAAMAQYALGGAYERGDGVPRDYLEAYMWVSLAAAQGYAHARESLDRIETRLTPEQRGEAQKMSREWKPQ
jgi:TPR repeat protein